MEIEKLRGAIVCIARLVSAGGGRLTLPPPAQCCYTLPLLILLSDHEVEFAMPAVSVAICCCDSARTLAAACQSVAWADELVVVDSGSRDGTPAIARNYADRFVVEPWRGYTGQKQYAVSLCRNDWVLVLDSDEECSAELAKEIQALPNSLLEEVDVFQMPRRNYMYGRHIGCWDPDHQSRLIHRHRCRWRDEVLHDARLPSAPSRLRTLEGHLEHNRADDSTLDDNWDRKLFPDHLELVARDMYARGKRTRWFDGLRPWVAFVKYYLFKGGFAAGRFGWAIAIQALTAARLKYLALSMLEQRERLWQAARQTSKASAASATAEEGRNGAARSVPTPGARTAA